MRTRGLLGGAAGPCGVRKPAIAMIRPAVAVLSGVRRSQRGRKSALRVGGTERGSGRAMAAAGDLDGSQSIMMSRMGWDGQPPCGRGPCWRGLCCTQRARQREKEPVVWGRGVVSERAAVACATGRAALWCRNMPATHVSKRPAVVSEWLDSRRLFRPVCCARNEDSTEHRALRVGGTRH